MLGPNPAMVMVHTVRSLCKDIRTELNFLLAKARYKDFLDIKMTKLQLERRCKW